MKPRGVILDWRIASWLRWEPIGLGPYETIRARLMSRVLVGLLVSIGVVVPLQLVLPGSPLIALVPAVVVLEHLVGLALLWSGRQQTSALVVVSGAVAVMAVILYPLGGLTGTAVLYVGLAALLAVTWLEPRPAAAVVGLFVALLVGLWWVGPPPETIRAFAPGEELRRAQTICAVLAVTLVFGLVDATTHALHATGEEARHRAEEAARAREHAIRASEAKARFLATMSHELRTPLNAILGYSGLLREEPGPDTADLERIEIAGRQLLALVDDLLEMVRADQSPRPARLETIDLRALVDTQAAALASPEVTVTGPRTLVVDTDADHVRRIVDILLANAARYTRDDRVAVALSRDGDEIRLAVCDGGKGIPVSLLPLLFEPFVQIGPSAVTDRTELGIALSQRLAHHLGGRIEVESVQGRGATFTLCLPAGVA